MALVLDIWIRSRVCSLAENFLNHWLNRRPVFPASIQPVLNFLCHRFCIVSGTNPDPYTDGHLCIRWLTDEPMLLLRFFRCFCLELWPRSVSGTYSGHCTDAHQILWCLPSGPSDASDLTVVQTLTDLGLNPSGGYTDAQLSAQSVLPVP
jgi:hypothetical protein